MTNRNT